MKSDLRIAIVLSSAQMCFRAVSLGVSAYAREHPNWILRLVGSDRRRLMNLPQWKPDGIVAVLNRAELVRSVQHMAKRLRIPIVNALHPRRDPFPPQVLCDDRAVGAMAARHLLERGLRRLAYAGFGAELWSKMREEGFTKEALRANVHVCRYTVANSREYPMDNKTLPRWLRALPKPVGILTADDHYGLCVMEIAHRLRMPIPEQIAVIGVNNDDQICLLTYPTLSSVITPAEQVGFEAARLLDRLMSGGKPPTQPILLPPLGVALRASSDVIAFDDERLANALRFIHANFPRHINVDDVLRHVSMARRTLFNKFRAALGRTPLAEIQRLRLERARDLIDETDLPMREIALQAGYGVPNRMLAAFKKRLGVSPDRYRRDRRSRRRLRGHVVFGVREDSKT